MKCIYPFLYSICLSFAATSQVEIRDYTGTGGTQIGNEISGTVFSVTTDEAGMLIQHFAVKNVFGSDQYFGIKRLRIDVPADWTDGLSWGQDPDELVEGACYSHSSMNTNPWTSGYVIAEDHFPTVLDQHIGDLRIEINVQSNGTGLYRYYILPEQNSAPIDSVDLHINALTLSVENQDESSEIVISPNPVNDNLTINSTFEGDIVLKITDFIGKTVCDTQLSFNTFDVSGYNNGIYLLAFYRQDELIQTERIVVEH